MTTNDETPIRKAAVFFRSLAPEAATTLLSRLSSEEASRLRTAIRELGEVGNEERQSIAEEALSGGPSETGPSETSKPPRTENQRDETPGTGDESEAYDGVELVLSNAAETAVEPPPEKASTFIEDRSNGQTPEAIGEDPWIDSLSEAEPETIAGFLDREQPPAIALVLSHLPSHLSAAVLAEFDTERRAAILLQLSRTGDADPTTVRVIATELANWIQEHQHAQRRRAERVAKVQSILEVMPTEEREGLVEKLGEKDIELGEALGTANPPGPPSIGPDPNEESSDRLSQATDRMPLEPREMIVARLSRLNAGRLLTAARALPARTALLAIAELPPTQQRALRKRLSRTAARDLSRRLETIMPMRLRDVEDAQRSLDAAVRRTFQNPRHSQ